MNTFKDFLTEMASSVLYHYTSVFHALEILQDNEFHLSSSVGTSAEVSQQEKGKPYYLSTTRHKLGGYHLSTHKEGVMMVLDGQKLNQKYRTKAVDYWGHDFRMIDPRRGEAEDRLFSKEPVIPNAKSYIKEVHILMDRDDMTHDESIRRTRKLLIELKTNKIPHWVYNNKKDFLILNKNKSVKALDLSVDKQKKQWSRFPSDYVKREFAPWFELHYLNDKDKLSKEARSILYDLYGFRKDDTIARLSNSIHNNRTDRDYKKYVQRMTNIMRDLKADSVREFVDIIDKKWNKD